MNYLNFVTVLCFSIGSSWSTILNGFEAYKIVVDPSDLFHANMTTDVYHDLSLIQCATVANTQPELWRVFCLTLDGNCLLSNASFPPNYDDSTQGDATCYTTNEPLINICKLTS